MVVSMLGLRNEEVAYVHDGHAMTEMVLNIHLKPPNRQAMAFVLLLGFPWDDQVAGMSISGFLLVVTFHEINAQPKHTQHRSMLTVYMYSLCCHVWSSMHSLRAMSNEDSCRKWFRLIQYLALARIEAANRGQLVTPSEVQIDRESNDTSRYTTNEQLNLHLNRTSLPVPRQIKAYFLATK